MTTIIAIDLETSGLPQRKGYDRYYEPRMISYYDTCRVVSIGLVTNDGHEEYKIIKPIDFTITNSSFHGIDQQRALDEGYDLRAFFTDDVVEKIKNADLIVNHNINFDWHVLRSELIRQGLHDVERILACKKILCTMKDGKHHFGLDKWPTLKDLYMKCFNTPMTGNHHNALDDARASLQCYQHMFNPDP